MPGLIPKVSVTTTPDGIRATCSHCTEQTLRSTRPSADLWALNHEKAHLLGLIPREDT